MTKTRLVLGLLILVLCTSSAFSQVAIILDGEDVPLDLLFKNEEDLLFIPLKALCDRLGATYKYNPETKIVLLMKDRDTIKLQIDNTLAIVNDEWKYLKSPVQRVGEQIIVPFEAVAGFLGSKVSFRTSAAAPAPPASAAPPAPAPAAPVTYEAPPPARVYEPEPEPEFFTPSEDSIFGDVTYAPMEEPSPFTVKHRFSLGFYADYYRPDGWNVNGRRLERKFGINGCMRYGLGSHWVFEFGMGHWSNSKDDIYFGRGVQGTNRLELVPLNVDIYCYFMKDSRLKPFLGLGLTHYRVEHKYWNDNSERVETKDATTGFNVTGGLEYFFTPNFTMFNFIRYTHADLGLRYIAPFVPGTDLDFNIKLNDLFFGTGFAFWF